MSGARDPNAPPILAVDGGNSKADVALVGIDGTLLAAVRGPTISHQAVGLEEGVRRLTRLVTAVKLANLKIHEQAQRDPACKGMGTTIVSALFLDDKAPRDRLRSLAPYAVIAVMWAAVYKIRGYGTSGSGFYVDPGGEPAAFVLAVDNLL